MIRARALMDDVDIDIDVDAGGYECIYMYIHIDR